MPLVFYQQEICSTECVAAQCCCIQFNQTGFHVRHYSTDNRIDSLGKKDHFPASAVNSSNATENTISHSSFNLSHHILNHFQTGQTRKPTQIRSCQSGCQWTCHTTDREPDSRHVSINLIKTWLKASLVNRAM